MDLHLQFFDIPRSQACLGASLLRNDLPDQHKNHRILSLHREGSLAVACCECGDVLRIDSPGVVEYLEDVVLALTTDPYPMEKEALCLAVHALHPFHVPVTFDNTGKVVCSCGIGLQVAVPYFEPIPPEPIEVYDPYILGIEFNKEQAKEIRFFKRLKHCLSPKRKDEDIERWWLSEGLWGPVIRVETTKGTEDIDDTILLDLMADAYRDRNMDGPQRFSNETAPLIKALRPLEVPFSHTLHFIEKVATLLNPPEYKRFLVRLYCSCGARFTRRAHRIAKLLRE